VQAEIGAPVDQVRLADDRREVPVHRGEVLAQDGVVLAHHGRLAVLDDATPDRQVGERAGDGVVGVEQVARDDVALLQQAQASRDLARRARRLADEMTNDADKARCGMPTSWTRRLPTRKGAPPSWAVNDPADPGRLRDEWEIKLDCDTRALARLR
jgi:hypothetical protein